MKLICDIDGIITSGEHFYSIDGKIVKSFSSNDRPSIPILKKYFNEIILCSADNTSSGSKINEIRCKEMGINYIFSKVEERQKLIDENMPCVYVGDGINEPNALINLCLNDSTPQAKNNSDFILPTLAGKNVFPHILNWIRKENILSFAKKIRDSISGKIVITGVGKNFSLAQLVSEFFLPYNIVAVPLDANHSSHGSLGLININDIVIASSKSGDTEELINMMKSLYKKFNKLNTFLITSNSNAKAIPYFKNILVIDNIIENSFLGFSPQITIQEYLKTYFSILKVITYSYRCNREDYLLNHSGGTIGKNI